MDDATRATRELLREADQLADSGKTAEAVELLREVEQSARNANEVLSDVVSIYMKTELFDEAERVHRDYIAQHGRPLRADFTLEEIQNAKRRESTPDSSRFRRLSLRERGHLPNRVRLWPIREVVLTDETITLATRRGAHRFRWEEIIQARIEEKKAFKASGRFAGGHYRSRTLVLQTASKTFRLDVSNQYPDLERPKQLVEQLSKKLHIDTVNLDRD